MSDFYCEEVLSGKMKVEKVIETDNVLAYHHTRPSYQSHIVVIPKKHVSSLIALEDEDSNLLLDLLNVAKTVARQTVKEYGACRVVTNLGDYQDSKHLHWHVVYGNLRKSKHSQTYGEKVLEIINQKNIPHKSVEINEKGHIIVDKGKDPELYDWAVNG